MRAPPCPIRLGPRLFRGALSFLDARDGLTDLCLEFWIVVGAGHDLLGDHAAFADFVAKVVADADEIDPGCKRPLACL